MIPCPLCQSTSYIALPEEVRSLKYYCQRCSILFNCIENVYEYVALDNLYKSPKKDLKSYFTGMKDAILRYYNNQGMKKDEILKEIEEQEKKFV